VNPGQMRHQVRIEQRSTAQDSAGDQVLTWSLVAERRASIDRTPGSEVWASAQRNARVPTVFRLRYLTGVMPAMRLICSGKVFDIVSAIDPDGRGAELVVTALELVEEPAT